MCIMFFRGYYNYQLKLVKNNSKVLIHYLKSDFFFDLLSALPSFSLSNFLCTYKKEKNNCLREGRPPYLISLVIIINLKIIKIFKVRNKQKNIIFDNFFNLFSENYSLEKSIGNILDFIYCILVFQFFVCLNIFLSRQTYSNWIVKFAKSRINLYLSFFMLFIN